MTRTFIVESWRRHFCLPGGTLAAVPPCEN
jgi:hypothetical protein